MAIQNFRRTTHSLVYSSGVAKGDMGATAPTSCQDDERDFPKI